MMQDRVKYVIATHRSYEVITLPRLLRSLTDVCCIPTERLLVVSGGYAKAYEEVRQGIPFSCVEHNSFDHTGLIDIIEHRRVSDFWFSLHDTCQAQPHFYALSCTFDPQFEYISTNAAGWLNMGLFSWSFLQRESDYILSLKNCDKIRAMFSERVYLKLAHSSWYGEGQMQNHGTEDIYGVHTPRLKIYLPQLDLYKFQANWKPELDTAFVTRP